jgi:hypothetical protein
VTGLLAIVADLGSAGVAVSSGRAAATVSVESVATAVGSAVLGSVILLRLLAELNGDARSIEITVVQFLDRLIGVLLFLVVNEGVISLR